MRKTFLLNIYFSLFVHIFLFGQNINGLPIITKYTPVDYHASGQIFSIAQDSLGCMYFGSPDGILKFDGTNWTIHKLPNDAFPRCVYITPSGKLYVAGQTFIYRVENLDKDDYTYVSLLDKLPEDELDFYTIWRMVANDSALYLNTGHKVFKIDADTSKVFEFEDYVYNIDLIDNKLYVSKISSYSIIENDKIETFPTKYSTINFFKKNDTIFYFNNHLEICYLDKNNKSVKKSDIDIVRNKELLYLRKLIPYGEDKYIFVSSNYGVYILDNNYRQIQHINISTGLISDNVYYVYIDLLNNLWVASDNGISYIELNTPFSVIDDRLGLKTTSSSILGFFNKKLYLYNGVSVSKLDFRDSIKIEKVENIQRQCWKGIKIKGNFYVTHNPSIVRIDKNDKVKIYGSPINTWDLYPFDDSLYYLLTANDGIYIYINGKDSLEYVKKVDSLDVALRNTLRDKKGYYWFEFKDGALRIKFDSNFNIIYKKLYNEKNGLLDFAELTFYNWKDKFLISTNKKIYEYDYDNDTVIALSDLDDNFDLSGQKYLSLIAIDSNNNLWVDYDDGINHNYFALTYTNNGFKEKFSFVRRLQKALVTDIIRYKKYYFLYSNLGFFIFDTTKQNILNKYQYFTLIRKIILTRNDSTIYIDRTREYKQIKYKDNDIRFEYASPFYIMPKKILYRYKLLNYKNQWSNWSYGTYIGYTNLPPGSYMFEVQAKNIYGQVSEPAKFYFRILPPWYRTVWAYIGYVVLLLVMFYVAVKIFTENLRRKNEKLEQVVKERTKEILTKNAELEQQKEEIMMQAEELSLVNQELEKLSVVVRETDNAVIITDPEGNFIWINSAFTKMFGYTFEELVNYISKNIVSDNTDPEIRAKVMKCINEKVTVNYELKVRNKFNKEIWVHTTLTPILNEYEQIESLVAIDSDITLLKKAERKIREQKEQITSSIRYARTIQESVLPKKEILEKFFDIRIIYYPKDIVSGDFYWISNIFREKEGRRYATVIDDFNGFDEDYSFYFVVADCTGHGVPGAFMSFIGNYLLRTVINEEKIEEPKDILKEVDKELNAILHRKGEKNMDGIVISLLKFVIMNNEREIKKITFAGAKQNIVFYNNKSGDLIKLRGAPREVGFRLNDDILFTQNEFYLEKDDLIFLYTDGLKDLNSPSRKSLGFNRIIRLLEETVPNPDAINVRIKQEIKNWSQGATQRDDITFVTIKLR